MHSFLIGLQFLTRIRFVRQTTWTAEDFGRSTRFFPLVGLVLGLCYMLAAWVLIYFLGVRSLTCVLILILPILLTGGIHADGFMDTADGIFSGRERARQLEIMKDSRAGAFGVVSFVMLMFVQFALISDMHPLLFVPALFVMPIIGRLAMVLSIRPCGRCRKDLCRYGRSTHRSHRCCDDGGACPAVGRIGGTFAAVGRALCPSFLPHDHQYPRRSDR